MKKFNKFLALGLAGASLLSGGLLLSGCDITDDKDNTQTELEQDEQKVVSSISINADSLPSYIIKGKFSRTNIKATVTYEDNTTKVIDVTESMFSETDKEKLKNVGQYNLTVNYGDKTATMYANVVDERYLLKEVVEANLNKDVTLSVGNNTCQIDADNKIIKYTDVDDGWTGYTWLSNNVTYNYEAEEVCNKSLASDWEKESYYYHTMDILNILENGKDSDGDTWTIDSVEKEGVNYILTARYEVVGQDYILTYKYIFNDDFLCKIECEDNDPETWEYNFNYAPITLSLPSEIKALESSAKVHVASGIDDLNITMESYLQSDFEMSIFDNSSNTTYLHQQYDADNKIIKEIDPFDTNEGDLAWINGDYYYSYYYVTNSIYKDNISSWDRHIMVNCFTFDDDFANAIVDISEDGQYYELISTSEDGDGEVWEYKYIFNDEEINEIKVTCDGQYMGSYTYNRTNVNLEVPADIKALESSAAQQ